MTKGDKSGTREGESMKDIYGATYTSTRGKSFLRTARPSRSSACNWSTPISLKSNGVYLQVVLLVTFLLITEDLMYN